MFTNPLLHGSECSWFHTCNAPLSRPISLICIAKYKGVAGATAACGVFLQNAALNQVINVARCGWLRDLGNFFPLRRSKLSLESIEQAIQHHLLAFVEAACAVLFPECRLLQDVTDDRLSAVEGATKTTEKPVQPIGDVERATLGSLKDVVVGFALLSDLRGHAVEALRALLRPRERQIGDRTRDSSVAVLERMDGHKPQMRKRGLDDRVLALLGVEPVQK